MLKPLYLLVELLLVVDGIPLSIDLKADVVAFVHIGRCYDHVWQIYFDQCRLMLLPCVFGFGDYDLRLMLLAPIVMADVIAMWQMLSH